MPDDRTLKPYQLADMGLIDNLSMHKFAPDQRMVEEALNINQPQQGGVGDTRSNSTVPSGATQSGGNRSPVSPGF